MITPENATDFLLRCGLIGTDAVVDGNLEITSTNRRNRNLQIAFHQGGVLLKQPEDPTHESADSLRQEARFYRFCGERGLLRDLMPPLVLAHDDAPRLMIELYRDALPLWRYYRQRGGCFPVSTAQALGRSLHAFHRQARTLRAQARHALDFLKDTLPFAFRLHRPHPRMLAYLSAGSHALIESLQADTSTCSRLDELSRLWHTEAVIHGDIKMDNVLILQPQDQDEAGSARLRLIDWEMVQWGDTAWDVGGVFQDFVFWWVISMPQQDDRSRMVSEASFPIESLRAGSQAFWHGYRRDIDDAEAEVLMQRAIRFAACRMIQTAYEIASRFDHVPTPSAVLLQAGMNLLKEPERGISQFFALREVSLHAA